MIIKKFSIDFQSFCSIMRAVQREERKEKERF